jgi:hypothetical protein
MRESLTVRGWDLMEGYFRDVEVLVMSSPAAAGENSVVVGRTGAVWHRKRHGPGRFGVIAWVGDSGATRAQVRTLWDEVLRVCAQPHSLAPVEWTLSDGSVRTCQAELVGEIVPVPLGQRGFRGQLEFSVPGAYWWGATGSASATVGAALPTLDSIALTWLAPMTAPAEHLTYSIAGTYTSVTIAAPSTGDSFTYTLPSPQGGTVLIDSGSGAVTGSGGHVPNPQGLAYTSDRILTVAPGLPGDVPEVTVAAMNGPNPVDVDVTVAGAVPYL